MESTVSRSRTQNSYPGRSTAAERRPPLALRAAASRLPLLFSFPCPYRTNAVLARDRGNLSSATTDETAPIQKIAAQIGKPDSTTDVDARVPLGKGD